MLNSVFIAFVLSVLTVAAVSYLLGSISFSILFTRLFDHNTDIRSLGSGNAGTTNVLRSVGVKAGVLTLLCDFSKGGVAVFAGREIFGTLCAQTGLPPYFQQYGAFLAGLFCVLGHIYPLYFQFKGGKGISATAAVLALVDWRVFLIGIGIFAIVFAFTKIVSISSILGSVSFPISNLLLTYFADYARGSSGYCSLPVSYVWITTAFAVLITFILVFKHRENIRRLRNGTEKKLTIKHSA
jgi:acyl phosphate:glycerol-3-phosphate acyltransferase